MSLAPWLAAAAGSALLLAWLPAPRRPRAALVLFAAGLASQSVECVPPPAGSFFGIHTDHLGTPLAMSDTPATASAAKVVWRAKYEPFGQAAVNPDPDGDGTQVQLDLRFPGQIYDAETGLHYNYFRTYDPRTGRYLEADPVLQSGGIHRYAYVDSNPLRSLDRRGLAGSGITVDQYDLLRALFPSLPAPPLPGYLYCGPGNGPGGVPSNSLDAACRAHDHCYAGCSPPLSAPDVGRLRRGQDRGPSCQDSCDDALCRAARVFEPPTPWDATASCGVRFLFCDP